MDPACGSGHILVEAYDLLKEIYLERGYNRRDIPELIITKNLYGLDIDLRAVQLASFAVAMKALKDNPRLINAEIKPNIMAIDETNALNKLDLVQKLLPPEKVKEQEALMALLDNFENGKTYGSLIKIAPTVCEKLPLLKTLVNEALLSGHIFASSAAEEVLPFVKMAEILSQKYDCVIANPPYMGSKGQSALLKAFLSDKYKQAKSDLFSAFILQNLHFSKDNGHLGFMTPFVWMFISSYEELRNIIIQKYDLSSLVQLEYSGFDGATVPICTFTLTKNHIKNKKGCFIKLSDFRGAQNQAPKTLEAIQNRKCGWFYEANSTGFSKIPGTPIAYWASDKAREAYKNKKMDEIAQPRHGLATSDNDRFLKMWYEVNLEKTSIIIKNQIQKKWFPMNKGGSYRKWYGNLEWVINYENDGKELKDYAISIYKCSSRTIQNTQFYFKESLTWSALTSGEFSVRWSEEGALFGSGGYSAFTEQKLQKYILALLNSKMTGSFIQFVSPTLNYEVGHIKTIPVVNENKLHPIIDELIDKVIHFSKTDWDSFETSWDFERLPILSDTFKKETLAKSYQAWRTQNAADIAETKRLEEENNRLFIETYGLQEEITPEVPIEQITLTVNPRYRYKNTEATDEELESRFKADSMKDLISYAIGCYMGRYSLDKTGLVYANEKNIGFDATKYQTIPADGDGIIPLTDTCWFPEEDMVNRLVDFVKTVWGQETLAENLDFIASGLDRKSTETAVEAIRRYLTKDFYKNHLQMYKNRPIYWLFSSGKEKAFECLVYMHRMNEQTLAHIRMQFVVPLISKMNGALENMDKDIAATDSSAKQRQLNKEKEKLVKQYAELNKFDDALNHAINERITMDLDDGVKVNYAKFVPLVAESKKVVGK